MTTRGRSGSTPSCAAAALPCGGTVMFQIGRQSSRLPDEAAGPRVRLRRPCVVSVLAGRMRHRSWTPNAPQLVGHACTCVLFVNRNRNAHAVRGRVYGCGRVSAETDDHLGLMPGEECHVLWPFQPSIWLETSTQPCWVYAGRAPFQWFPARNPPAEPNHAPDRRQCPPPQYRLPVQARESHAPRRAED